MAKKKKEEQYVITFSELIWLALTKAFECREINLDAIAKDITDEIELYLRRHYSKDGIPAIVLTDDGFEFTSVERTKK